MCQKSKIGLYMGIVVLISQIITILWTIALSILITKSSRVIESSGQKGIHISDYCPKMEYCPEGTHVMCMYYNPNAPMGPRCSNPQNVTITPELATKILDISNKVRSKIALGKEKGKDGIYLPRAYGVFRLKWDEELATFAQVLANTCVLKHDLCRASKQFPDPGQVEGLVRFSYPDWYPVTSGLDMNTTGLTPEKMSYAISQSLKSWYGQKSMVSAEMIVSSVDWERPGSAQNLYLEMIYGPATHMGCGVSAYTEYAFHDNNAGLNYNSVQIICNFSARPRKGRSVYNTTRPARGSFECGCPDYAVEDDDCLCSMNPKILIPATTTIRTLNLCQEEDESCDPNVVVLPIFTMENAPPQKMIGRQRPEESAAINDNDSMDIFHVYENEISGHSTLQSRSPYTKTLYGHNRPITHHKSPVNIKKQVKHRYFDKNSVMPAQHYHKTQSPGQGFGHVQQNKFRRTLMLKRSLFSKVPKFELPVTRNDLNSNIQNQRRTMGNYLTISPKIKPVKKDVLPRKDFSHLQSIINDYLKKKRNQTFIPAKQIYESGHSTSQNAIFKKDKMNMIIHSETTTKTVENYNHFSNQKFHIDGFNTTKEETLRNYDINNYNEEADNKLLSLLDTLEQEVKHIELKSNEKQIFDEKMRKIYGNVIGKPVHMNISKQTKIESHKTEDNIKSNYYINNKSSFKDFPSVTNIGDVNLSQNENLNFENRYDNNEKFEKGLHSDYNYNTKPITRNQNSLIPPEDEHFKDYRNSDRHGIEYDLIKGIKPNNQDGNYRTGNFRNRYLTETDGAIETNTMKRHHRNKHFERVKEKNFYLNTDHDPTLNLERREYYQKKLNKAERKLHNARRYRNRNINESYVSKERDMKNLLSVYGNDDIFTKHERYARHVETITESILSHLLKEIHNRYSNTANKQQKSILYMIQKMNNKMKRITKSRKHKKLRNIANSTITARRQ